MFIFLGTSDLLTLEGEGLARQQTIEQRRFVNVEDILSFITVKERVMQCTEECRK